MCTGEQIKQISLNFQADSYQPVWEPTCPVVQNGVLVERGIDHEVVVLPCGHYSTGVTPFKWIDGIVLCRFLSRSL